MADFNKKPQHANDVNKQQQRTDAPKQPIAKEAHAEIAHEQKGANKDLGRDKQHGERLEKDAKNLNKKS